MKHFSVEHCEIKDLAVLERKPVSDNRGQFDKLFCLEALKELLGIQNIAQVNHSKTVGKGTIRGLHYQKPPYSEMKIVSCIRGKIFDVAVDIRKNSPTFLKWHGVVLSAKNYRAIIIPQGFAHGFQTLTETTELIYLHTQPYRKKFEAGLNAEDPAIRINWPQKLSLRSTRDEYQQFIDSNFKGIAI